jgi:hypothetical protein
MAGLPSGTYSFLDINCSITGPGGSFSLGQGAGAAEEGITIERTGDKDTMTIGADGTPMHSLHADKSGRITVRILKTSPSNALLQAMYDVQSLTSANWGYNVILVSDLSRGDTTAARACAFVKFPNIVYAKEGGINEWVFNSGYIDAVLGA